MKSSWTFIIHSFGSAAARLMLQNDGEPATFREVLIGLARDRAVQGALLDGWRALPLTSYVWELPPLTLDTLDRAFESVATSEPALEGTCGDPSAFRLHLKSTEPTAFPNLGSDAWLVAPSLGSVLEQRTSGHLATFSRTASLQRAGDTLALFAHTALTRLSNLPRWLNTSGLGVPWVHFRIDSSPKYYQYVPYRSPDHVPHDDLPG